MYRNQTLSIFISSPYLRDVEMHHEPVISIYASCGITGTHSVPTKGFWRSFPTTTHTPNVCQKRSSWRNQQPQRGSKICTRGRAISTRSWYFWHRWKEADAEGGLERHTMACPIVSSQFPGPRKHRERQSASVALSYVHLVHRLCFRQLYSLEHDLRMSDKQYLLALTLFFFPYSLFEVCQEPFPVGFLLTQSWSRQAMLRCEDLSLRHGYLQCWYYGEL